MKAKPKSRFSSPVLALVLSAVALAAGGYTVAAHLHWRSELGRLETLARETGILDRRPDLLAQLEHEADPTRAALRLARALLADELDQTWIESLPETDRDAERVRGLARLDAAFELGEAVLAERPASWEALMVVGGSNYLRFSRRRDPSLRQDELWLGPLQAAHELAPTQNEPLRLLAATYLGRWSVLSTEERAQASEILKEAFVDPVSFDLLATSWLRVAPSLAQALSLVPDRPAQWSLLSRYFRRIGDWERHSMATDRYEGALRMLIEERLTEARMRHRGGDARVAIQRLRWIGATAVPDTKHASQIERAVAALPPGSIREADTPWLEGWLQWTLERYLDRGAHSLSREATRRLSSLSSRLPAPLQAWGLAAGGDREGAARLEPENLAAAGDEWRSYALAKARLLSDDGGSRDALALLRRMPRPDGDSLHYWHTWWAVAEIAGDADAMETANRRLSRQAADRWSADSWRSTSGKAGLDLYPSRVAEGLRLRVRVTGIAEGIMTVRWDGSKIGTFPTTAGRIIEIDRPIERHPHHLEIRVDRRSTIASAEVILLPQSPQEKRLPSPTTR